MKKSYPVFLLGVFLCFSLLANADTTSRAVISAAQANLVATQIENKYWNLPSYLGQHFVSQSYLFTRWLRVTPYYDVEKLKTQLLESQTKEGCWQQLQDSISLNCDLNASLFNYWALKAMGHDTGSVQMKNARSYILLSGGLEKTALFTKIILALFGNYAWSKIPTIPEVLFSPYSPVQASDFAQWIGPHILPISFLRGHEVVHAVMGLDLKELGSLVPRKDIFLPSSTSLIPKLVNSQQPLGSWGGYTLATYFSIASLSEHLKFERETAGAGRSLERGKSFLSNLARNWDPANKGVLDDGRYWDTSLALISLLESGYPKKELIKTAEYLKEVQTPSGGFPFGLDLSYAPDTDDTAIITLGLRRLGLETEAEKAVAWLRTMQSSDGGWGAFSRNNRGNFVLNHLIKDFKDSASLFDESSADVTAHVLEALSESPYSRSNQTSIRNAVKFLRQYQTSFGGWWGRWGINYVYGTGAVLSALAKSGVTTKDPMVEKAVQWLIRCQNTDGGFGESKHSYLDTNYACKGASTPSQTAWALMGLVAGGKASSSSAKNAAEYLKENFIKNGKWEDAFPVGTGHPGILYMQYPSYALTFPLWALSRYQKATGE